MVEIIPNWHPIFVHFTIGLLTAGTVFYLLALAFPLWRERWLTVARWNLWAGTAITGATVFFGWRAFNRVVHDEVAHAVMLEHRNLALTTFAVFLALTAWSVARQRRDERPGWPFAVLLLVGLGLLADTAWHGAELVYRHGLGVLSWPQPGGHRHADESGDEHTHGEGR